MTANFEQLADAFLENTFSKLEQQDTEELLDVDLISGVLTITVEADGGQFVINKHSASCEIWLSSPLSGGLHFKNSNDNAWQLADGRNLEDILAADLSKITSFEFVL